MPADDDGSAPTLLHHSIVHSWFGLQLVRDQLEEQNGHRYEYTYVEHPGSVVVVPRLWTGEYILVEQYRYPIHRRSQEFPAGSRDGMEEADETARRELLEETSLTAGELQELGQIAPSNGFCSEQMTVFLATGLTGTPHAHTTTTPRERHIVTVVGEAQLLELVRAGDITDSATLSALLLVMMCQGAL